MRNRVIGAVAQAGFPVSLSLAPFCDGSLWLSVQGMFPGTVAKLAMRQPFVLFKGLTFQKLCL
ncbi:hypothetical protein, partial [Escherichia coli]|uniref:hypothetical protein n=1 Tax=Escherichia coli TaxID=562 RepID=UPI0021C7A20F